ncbi:MAG: archaeal proteasome endopeptidase complex subunit beta [Crenarchaeota archaeon]|nr:archaeal proteasome endopeptidase complex subunit beta [Thermoproteota archaeon]
MDGVGTVLGIKAKDGIVLAGEKRLTYDGFVLSRNVRKVHPITNHIGIGVTGLMGDAQVLLKMLRFEAKNYELQHNRRIRVRAMAKMASIILYSYKLMPMMTETIIAGVDDKGPQLFVLDPVGSYIEDKYAALGSGGPLALGILEKEYSDNMSVKEASELAVSALEAALKRDVMSGDGIDLLIITKDGYELKEYLFK